MIRTAPLAAAIAALALTPAVMAKDGDDRDAKTTVEGTPVKLVSFDGEQELLQKSSRMRIWRSHLAYKLTVDAEGNVTGCELTEKFRRAYVSRQLCKLLVANHTFEPARDASDQPVEGSYTNRISYVDLRAKY